ncbi:MAG TPA: hypothetical protein VFM38_11530 [Candidatus Limnocylindrales bacterium]|nr:hypothetical protein [Candidatus Limnocylindrales bacterium]
MIGRHRNALVIAIGCVLVAIAYGALAQPLGYHVEWAGVTMLIALGAALGLMFLVLHTGQGE